MKINKTLHLGDCIEVMRTLDENSVDSIVTDPPYELGFMGKSWDSTGIAFNTEVWKEALRVLKPGGHLIAFSGSRTYHRMAVAIEDAGFEIRDQIMWIYGSGFPKSLDVAKSIEAKLTTGSANKTAFKNLQGEQVERGNWGIAKQQQTHGQRETNYDETAGETRLGKVNPTTPEAAQWQGWGTALKPAHEPMVLARKPLIGTVAANVLEYGTGGLNIDKSRVGSEERTYKGMSANQPDVATFRDDNWIPKDIEVTVQGRFPANVIHDGSEQVVKLFPTTKSGDWRGQNKGVAFDGNENGQPYFWQGDSGSAARFFYCAKASKRDRNEGLDDFEAIRVHDGRKDAGIGENNPRNRTNQPKVNHHPTVKPTDLMRYLCRLITPPNGIVLDPFMGSGSTGKACAFESFNFVGIEREEDYFKIANARIEWAENYE